MTYLEMTKLCAEALGLDIAEKWLGVGGDVHVRVNRDDGFPYGESDELTALAVFDPLHDDAQAMALAKRFNVAMLPPFVIGSVDDDNRWQAYTHSPSRLARNVGKSTSLNRAIVECVAKMRAAKK